MARRHRYAGGIAATGLFLTLLQVAQGVMQLERLEVTDRTAVFALETLPFVVTALGLTYVGYWLATQTELERELSRVVVWCAGSVVLFAAVAVLLVFSLQVTLGAGTVEQAPYVAGNLVTVGALAGVLVGIYDARSTVRQRELQHERDRIQQFARKAADVNNYGRELNRSASVDEVSSLCLQAMQAFLGLTNLAFVVTDGEGVELVDDTTVGVPSEALQTLVSDSLDQPRSTFVSHDVLPEGFAGSAEGAVTLLVTRRDGSAVVLVALTDDPDAVCDEDVQLLEMLVAHAATALDRIYDETGRQQSPR